MKETGVQVNDLHEAVAADADRLLAHDGTHLTPAGYELLAEVVTGVIEREVR
jgi:lysophospholipase L1-like esterase